jgi:hypothetical protein
MNSSMIGKIEKAHRYAQEPERVKFDELAVTFKGSHDDYHITFEDHQWKCTCHTFTSHAVGTCSHVMAMQQLLAPMLADDARFAAEPAAVVH